MRVAFGLKAHSGWAVLLALGKRRDALVLLERCRIELVDAADAAWARQPYHAAEGSSPAKAREIVRRGIEAAQRGAMREMRSALARAGSGGHAACACGVLVGSPMPDWSVDEILAVHIRMHKAEGVLFKSALLDAARACGLQAVAVPERELLQEAEERLGAVTPLLREIAALGKTCGPPWGKDHKEAALAALLALQRRPRRVAARA
jgi:hypothetical protein